MIPFLWGVAIWLGVGCLCGIITLVIWDNKAKWPVWKQRLNFLVMVGLGPIGIPVMIIRGIFSK